MSNKTELWQQIASNYGVSNTSGLSYLECLRQIVKLTDYAEYASVNFVEGLRIFADATA